MPLRVSVVAADHEVWSGVARQVVAKTVTGEIGLLAGHQPVLGLLAPGELRITAEDGTLVRATASDGFLSMEHDVVTVVADSAELVA